MATLNVKNFSDDLYARLRERARREHRSIAQETAHLLSQALERPAAASILDLRGLGKDAWVGIDAVQHVEAERSSWT